MSEKKPVKLLHYVLTGVVALILLAGLFYLWLRYSAYQWQVNEARLNEQLAAEVNQKLNEYGDLIEEREISPSATYVGFGRVKLKNKGWVGFDLVGSNYSGITSIGDISTLLNCQNTKEKTSYFQALSLGSGELGQTFSNELGVTVENFDDLFARYEQLLAALEKYPVDQNEHRLTLQISDDIFCSL